MGSNINEFVVRLEFGPDGEVTDVTYWDRCGHERTMSISGWSLDDMTEYHLKHYRESHDLRPPLRCPFTVDTLLPHAAKMRCVLEPHDTAVNHRFEMRS